MKHTNDTRRLDMMIYGHAYELADGTRINPAEVSTPRCTPKVPLPPLPDRRDADHRLIEKYWTDG